MNNTTFVLAFREAAPYLHYLSGKTVVLALSSHILDNPLLMRDIALLHHIGLKVVLVHGVRHYIEEKEHDKTYHHDKRVTNRADLETVKQLCGQIRCNIEAALSMGFSGLPAPTQTLSVASGNFVFAKPLGVIDGIDMQFTGSVRKIDTESIKRCLNHHQLVLISPMGYSFSGETYNLRLPEVAAEIAITLGAEKLVFLSRANGLVDENKKQLKDLSVEEAESLFSHHCQHEDINAILPFALQAASCGVKRVQLINGTIDGALFSELFTRQGIGTSLAHSPFTHIRAAKLHDIPDLLRLIHPMSQNGTLLPRNQNDLEQQIEDFIVLEHDNIIYGCAALKRYPQENIAEIASLAVSKEAQASGYGEQLLAYIVRQAKAEGFSALLALTTRAEDWFRERGFGSDHSGNLPKVRQQEYTNSKRHSKILIKPLKQ